ncbi:GNAT family N-acetyltransferase [Bifidobacterium sp.]|jgi:RimJ/RimL family protein N-acetyltransferase|uniref:GNAT family N-acetyltransferase n=1 Tax=Bifidobacterium sp. TaxID=41200 RepID=UPI0025BB4B17|nr:GNAT family N-acetyltransferase [Bifidobacterium sp.]MCI1635055.1 GNAT family N-acetyltransferase [Bifidobacterium sp.]
MVRANEVNSPEPEQSRELPERLIIPEIKGEMVHLRPAGLDDLPYMDQLEAFYNASGITGKGIQAERAVLHTWVKRSVAWSWGQTAGESGVGDPESRRTIAWAMLASTEDSGDDSVTAAQGSDAIIGMIFLIDIDGWSRSARIQVVLGKNYRGRGYSRDAMPRVMTYGFAPEPAGLGLHRIWVSVPEKNTRSTSVYQSLGFVPQGSSRDALWDVENGKYQDLIVMDTLVDEYDPIQSLDAFGMHVIEDNPGVREALSAKEHSMALRLNQHSEKVGTGDSTSHVEKRIQQAPPVSLPKQSLQAIESTSMTGSDTSREHDAAQTDDHSDDQAEWPYNQSSRKTSKRAWWRNIGRSRSRTDEAQKD